MNHMQFINGSKMSKGLTTASPGVVVGVFAMAHGIFTKSLKNNIYLNKVIERGIKMVQKLVGK